MNTLRERHNTNGFGAIELLLILVVVVLLAAGGWYVWMREHRAKTSSTGSMSQSANATNSQHNTAPNPQPDPYEGWKTYTNSVYGISFRYPSKWLLTEGAVDSPSSATKQEYAIGLKRNDNVKYNDTVSIEVLGEGIDAAAAWSDSGFAQSPNSQVKKTTDNLKGHQSIQYILASSGGQGRLYLFSVGNKTYTFSSIDEDSNVQVDPDYWANFTKVFDSLQISQ